MELYDICMLVVLVAATLFGAWKGMAWQVASTASLVLSYVVALRFSEQLAPRFGQQAPLNRFIAMFVLSWQLGLLVLLMSPILIVATIWYRRMSSRAYLRVRDRIGGTLTALQEGLAGVRVIQAFGREKRHMTLSDVARATDLPLVLDADALNLLAAHPSLGRTLVRRRAATLLTPHPAEAARLLGTDTASVQADRLAAALEIARRFRAGTVLKGAGSIVATAGGTWSINGGGNPGLASAGSGDVLTGIVVALLAQGWPADAALAAAVHLHGEAAEWLVAAGTGPVGMTAGELVDSARHVFNTWVPGA